MKFLLSKEEEKKLIALFEQYDNNYEYNHYVGRATYDDQYTLLGKRAKKLEKYKTALEKKDAAFDILEKVYPIKNDFVKKTIRWETKVLETKHLEANPYYKALKSISFNEGEYRLEYPEIKAYALCYYGEEYAYGANYAINMSLAMIDHDFSYPSIYKKGLEWMSLSPYEMRTYEVPIALAKGHVLVLGLGIGYFAYMASLKEEVTDIHIVEGDPKLVEVFRKHLLPLFPHPEKIHIDRLVPFTFYDTVEDKDYDYIFCNMWFGVTYGAADYLTVKHHFDTFKYTQCVYYLENTMITYLRTLVVGIMKQEYYHEPDQRTVLEIHIACKLEDYEIKDSNDIDSLLNLKGLNGIFSDY